MSTVIMPIIPYLLSFVSTDIVSTLSPWYTFNVEISSIYYNLSTVWENTANVSFDLKCQLVTLNISRCYIPKSSIRYTSINNYKTDYEFTPSPLDYCNINFTMLFDDIGVKMYDIEMENIEVDNSLKMIYEMIGNQMNIGADIRSKGETFYETERFTEGTCQTKYRLLEAHNFDQLNYTLTSLTLDSYFKCHQTKSVEIRKDRAMDDCCHDCNRILGMILWTDLILTKDFTAMMMNSLSQMLIDTHYFSSSTNNFFILSDEKNNLIGTVREHIKLTLSTVDTSQMLCTSCSFIELDTILPHRGIWKVI